MDFTASWAWPQWTAAILIFLGFVLVSARHGQERVEAHGDRKGQPQRYSGFSALARATLWAFILIAGGFFA